MKPEDVSSDERDWTQYYRPDDHYLIRWYDPATLGGVPFGDLLELEKRGFHVGVDAQSSAGAGSEAGSAYPRLPPTVAAFRMLGVATAPAAWARRGQSRRTSGARSSWPMVTMAPTVSSPAWARSSSSPGMP